MMRIKYRKKREQWCKQGRKEGLAEEQMKRGGTGQKKNEGGKEGNRLKLVGGDRQELIS
jgi:hypothetical protein